jgi:hypothetical protein
MTDSEEEYEVDEFHRVGFAAEVACILAIGCVAGLKGLTKMRRGVRYKQVHFNDMMLSGNRTVQRALNVAVSCVPDTSYNVPNTSNHAPRYPHS